MYMDVILETAFELGMCTRGVRYLGGGHLRDTVTLWRAWPTRDLASKTFFKKLTESRN